MELTPHRGDKKRLNLRFPAINSCWYITKIKPFLQEDYSAVSSDTAFLALKKTVYRKLNLEILLL